jgi:hypothetical protein
MRASAPACFGGTVRALRDLLGKSHKLCRRRPRLGRLGSQPEHKLGILRSQLGLRMFQTEIAVSLNTSPRNNDFKRFVDRHDVITKPSHESRWPAALTCEGILLFAALTLDGTGCFVELRIIEIGFRTIQGFNGLFLGALERFGVGSHLSMKDVESHCASEQRRGE